MMLMIHTPISSVGVLETRGPFYRYLASWAPSAALHTKGYGYCFVADEKDSSCYSPPASGRAHAF